MLVNLLPFVSLISVPLIVYSITLFFSMSNILILIPKLFSRHMGSCHEVQEPAPKYRDFFTQFYEGEFCSQGERLNFENSTVYLQSSLTSYYSMSGRNTSNIDYGKVRLVDRIARSFHTVVLDCPELSLSQVTDETSPVENDQSRILQHLKWITSNNLESRKNKTKAVLKIWFRLSTYSSNALRFDNLYCTALALAANRLYPGTVAGFLLNGDFITPLTTLKDSINWDSFINLWKARMRIFEWKLGLAVSWPSCLSLNMTDLTNTNSLKHKLSSFDDIYYVRSKFSGGISNQEEGVNWVVPKRFLQCRNLVSLIAPSAVKVKDVMHEVFVRMYYYSDKHCVIYWL